MKISGILNCSVPPTNCYPAAYRQLFINLGYMLTRCNFKPGVSCFVCVYLWRNEKKRKEKHWITLQILQHRYLSDIGKSARSINYRKIYCMVNCGVRKYHSTSNVINYILAITGTDYANYMNTRPIIDTYYYSLCANLCKFLKFSLFTITSINCKNKQPIADSIIIYTLPNVNNRNTRSFTDTS